MSTTTLNRLSGLALMLAFALCLAGGLLHPVLDHHSHTVATIGQPAFPLAHMLIMLGTALLLFGLPAAYARIAERTGLLGLGGFALYFLTNATLIPFYMGYEALVAPTLAANPATHHLAEEGGAITAAPALAAFLSLGGLVMMLGMLLLGIAVLRSRALPRWTGALLALAPILLLLPIPEQPILTGLIVELPRGLAVAGIGYALLTRSAGATHQARAGRDETLAAHSPSV
jgi:hypothetical protein